MCIYVCIHIYIYIWTSAIQVYICLHRERESARARSAFRSEKCTLLLDLLCQLALIWARRRFGYQSH